MPSRHTLRFQRILVPVKDPDAALPPAAERAVRLALRTGARIELLHVLYESGLYQDLLELPGDAERTIELLLDGVSSRLKKQAAAAVKRGAEVHVRAEWAAPAYEAIARRGATGFDLVVIGTGVRGAMQRLVLGYTDRELVRVCAQPLLIVKGERRYGDGLRVLAAVDPMHPHAHLGDLDARVIESAKSLARAFDGHVDLVHAVPDYGPRVQGLLRPRLTRTDPDLARELERRAGASVRRLARAHGIPAARVHLRTGHPIDVIAGEAQRLKAHVVVMGVVARGIVDRLRFGSTAESLLEELRCDILGIKPRGFRSPVSRHAGSPPRSGPFRR